MPKSMGSSLKIIFDHFFTISVFWLLLLRVFLFIFEIFISFRIFFYFTQSMKTITGRHHWVLTAESHRLTTMDDNNTFAVFAGYYTRSLFPLSAFLKVAWPSSYLGIDDFQNIETYAV